MGVNNIELTDEEADTQWGGDVVVSWWVNVCQSTQEPTSFFSVNLHKF